MAIYWLLIAAALSLAACTASPSSSPPIASPPPPPEPKKVWFKAGAGNQAFAVDKYDCMRNPGRDHHRRQQRPNYPMAPLQRLHGSEGLGTRS